MVGGSHRTFIGKLRSIDDTQIDVDDLEIFRVILIEVRLGGLLDRERVVLAIYDELAAVRE